MIEIDSVSSSDSQQDGLTRAVTEQLSGHQRTFPDMENSVGNRTPVDSPRSSFYRRPLSVNTSYELRLDEDGSGRWSTAAEIPSHEHCSSRCSRNTVAPDSPACSSSSRSGTFEELCEKQFRQTSAAVSPASPTSAFHGSLKSRLLQRAGMFANDLPQNSKDLRESQNSQFVRESPSANVQSDSIRIHRSPPEVSQQLSESHTSITQHNGIYADRLPQGSQYSGFRYLPSGVVPPVPSQTVYPALYRPGLAYHEAAATAALFYNQLAAVHHLQQQQRILLGARNQLTVTSESHAHPPVHCQKEMPGLIRLRQADQTN